MADLIMNDPKHGVDCIFYPSVAFDLVAINIALKPGVLDEKFILTELSEDFCIKSPDEFGRGWMGYRTAKGINLNHNEQMISWENQPLNMPELNLEEMMEIYKAQI